MKLAKPHLIRSRIAPHIWSILVTLGDQPIEADIRPSTQRRLEAEYDVEVDPASSGQTYEAITLSPKKTAV